MTGRRLRQRMGTAVRSGKITFGLRESVVVAVLAVLITVVAAYQSGTLLTASS